MRRRFKADDLAGEHDDASTDGDPTPTTIVPVQTGGSTNGHGAPTLVEHVGDDIVVWPAPDEDAWASNGSSPASAVPVTTESADADEADEWLGVGAASRFVNLHFILGAVKRRRRWVIGSAIAGLVVGLLLSVASAPTPQAETKVLLTFPASSDRTLAMATDTQLLKTDAVARRVVNALHLRESPSAFAASYNGTGLSDDLLSISVSAPSSADAVRPRERVGARVPRVPGRRVPTAVERHRRRPAEASGGDPESDRRAQSTAGRASSFAHEHRPHDRKTPGNAGGPRQAVRHAERLDRGADELEHCRRRRQLRHRQGHPCRDLQDQGAWAQRPLRAGGGIGDRPRARCPPGRDIEPGLEARRRRRGDATPREPQHRPDPRQAEAGQGRHEEADRPADTGAGEGRGAPASPAGDERMARPIARGHRGWRARGGRGIRVRDRDHARPRRRRRRRRRHE